MESQADVVQFRLPVTWDIAMRVLKHAARNGQTRLEIYLHGNGYLQLRQARLLRHPVAIDITLIAAEATTTVLAADVTRGVWISRRERRRVAALLEQFRSDAEYFASHPGRLDQSTSRARDRQSPRSTREFTRLSGTTVD